MQNENELRILVIDDNASIHKDFIKILTRKNTNEQLETLDKQLFGEDKQDSLLELLPKFKIDTALQGEEGVELIEKAIEEKKPYSLAFVDIRMPPGWDGIETIKHIWNLDSDIQIVICTAYSDYSWEETVKKLSMSDNLLILKKPFDIIAVRQLACALTKKWQLLQESRHRQDFLESKIEKRTHSLHESLSLLRATLESSNDGILVVSKEGNIVDYNNRFVEMFNIPKSVLKSKNNKTLLKYLLIQVKHPKLFSLDIKKIDQNFTKDNIDVVKFKDDRVFERYSQPHIFNDEVIGRVWNFRDITGRIKLEEKLEFQATHDLLTDLPNRLLMEDRLKKAIDSAKRNHTMIGILYLDLDRFKLVNDSFGHDVGDKLLKIIAERLNKTFREEDTVARMGGDEFVVILSNLESENAILDLSIKALAVFQSPFSFLGHRINITSSTGICVYPRDGKQMDELLRNADLAMYLAKELGGNQFRFYTESLNVKSKKRLKNELDLQNALENNEFFLCYQAQYDLESQSLVAMEALIRWRHPIEGVIAPLDFIPLAEESGIIVPIGEWVLRAACKQNKKWQEQGFPPINIAVNVTSKQLKQPDFVETVDSILKETNLDPKYLELELTENIIVKHVEVVDTIMRLKKDLGIKIVLDDFGMGASSLSYLRKFPIDILKIDRSFITNIDLDKGDELIVKAIIELASNLGLQVIAEGIENKEQLKVLINQRCQGGQGYYFGKPQMPDEIEKIFKDMNTK